MRIVEFWIYALILVFLWLVVPPQLQKLGEVNDRIDCLRARVVEARRMKHNNIYFEIHTMRSVADGNTVYQWSKDCGRE